MLEHVHNLSDLHIKKQITTRKHTYVTRKVIDINLHSEYIINIETHINK